MEAESRYGERAAKACLFVAVPVSLGRIKKKPGSRGDVVVGGKGEGKGRGGKGEEEENGDRDKGGRGETRKAQSQQNQFETPAWQKMDRFARLGNTPFQPSIMVSPRACASASLITSPQNISLITTPSNDLDSITLGQLKAMVNSAPKPKARISPLCLAYPVLTMMQQCYYDFKYDDEDTVLNEIEEFYSYVEMPQAAENLKAWEGSFQGGMYKLLSCLAPWCQFEPSLWTEWTKSQPQRRRAHVELLLESLEHKDVEIRFTNARRLLYILQGVVMCPFPGTSFTIHA